MTMLTGEAVATGVGARAEPGRATSRSLFESGPGMVIVGVCLGLALGWPKLASVWQSQSFYDTDDAMHLVVLRDWLGGQRWFDLTAHRMDPPQGVLMHWTRVLDVPLALLTRGFELFVTQDIAERLTRIFEPLLLQAALYAAIVSVTRKLVGKEGIAAAVVLAAFSLAVGVQFPPGRINHHNVEIVLLVLMLGATIDALDGRRTDGGVLAGFWAVLSLSIGLEDLPFVMVMLACFGVAWIVRGAAMARALAWLGGSLAASALLAFLAIVPPGRYLAVACDAFSIAHLVAAVAGGVCLVILAAASPRLPALGWRFAAAAIAGGLVVAIMAVAFPDCLGDPFVMVDPLVREVWIKNLTEALPLASLLQSKTLSTLPMALPIFVGGGLICLAAWRETGDSRARWLIVAAFAAIGIVGAFWQVRVATSVAAITVLGGAWLFAAARRWAAPRPRALVVAPVLLMLPLLPIAWAVALPEPDGSSGRPYGDPQACFDSSTFTALDALPPSVVFAPLDAGPYILAFTPHSVIAGPYHRNNHGNRLAIEAFLGDEETAQQRIRASGARYLAVCPAADELSVYSKRAPNGLAARLRDGAVPAWLQPVEVKGTPYRVYEMR
ncbi:MAG: hypothetical protein JO273_22965 [Methylobacteriaceae bacterium]|nr:hypothetical protein [Methylobacteriaceae bacterium]